MNVDELSALAIEHDAEAARLRGKAQYDVTHVRTMRAISYQLAALTAVLAAGLASRESSRVDRAEVEDGWYRVELMGHRRRHGFVTTAFLSGRQMVEIRQPVVDVGVDGELTGSASAVVERYAAAAVFSLVASSEDEAIDDARMLGGIPF